jgi:nicotinamide-nucleotide adenylyltransferase
MSLHFKQGLAVMRCQPFHNGHQYLIEKALAGSEQLMICLGSIQVSRTYANPFTFEERKEMITSSLDSELLKRIEFLGLKDIFNPEDWGGYVLRNLSRKVDAIYGGDDHDLHFYMKKGVTRINLERQNTSFMSGTKIRESMFTTDMTWRNFVPKGTLNVIDRILETEKKLWH